MYKRHEQEYKSYLAFQKKVQQGRGRFTRERPNRVDFISDLKVAFPDARKVLCVGARDESEVADLQKAGLEALGIDLFTESPRIIVLDMHKAGEYFDEGDFDVAFMSHSLEHSYDPEKVLTGMRRICPIGALIVVPMLQGPSRKEVVVFDFMRSDSPTPEMVAADIEAVAGPAEVPWVRPDVGKREIVFPVRWR
jgi:hypothetical protein